MVINSVNAAAPEIYGNRSEKKAEETARGSFAEAINNAASENVNVKTNADIAEFTEAGTKRCITNGSYTVTEEQAEYFREKYGEEYDEEKAKELYYQLADNGIISENDAGASGYAAIGVCDVIGNRSGLFFGSSEFNRLFSAGLVNVRMGERHLVKSIQFTDDDPDSYKAERDLFESQYDREVVTWEDALQKEHDFYTWWKDYAKNCSTGKNQPSQDSFDRNLVSLEKTMEVIRQIFG